MNFELRCVPFETVNMTGLLVSIPDDATNIKCGSKVISDTYTCTEVSFDDSTNYCMFEDAPLFDTHLSLIGEYRDLTDADFEQIIETLGPGPFGDPIYKTYFDNFTFELYPKLSFNTLLQSLGIDSYLNTRWLILKLEK